MSTHPARRMWRYLETLHAVTYFAPESKAAMERLGLKGFWMGYFAGRGAPFGACGPGVIEATFYNFDPARVRRAIPDAWRFAEPPAVLEAGCLAEIFAGAAVKSHRLPAVYADVARRHGIALLDAATVIVSSPRDGVHFEREEHAKLGRAVAASVREMMA